MSKYFWCIFLFSFVTKNLCESQKVLCDTVENETWTHDSTEVLLKTCFIENHEIDSKNFKIVNEKDEVMKGLVFTSNTKVLYLPVDIFQVFPSIETYLAEECSIQEIIKENFRGLVKLKMLILRRNKISTIRSGTFEGLHALKTVELSI